MAVRSEEWASGKTGRAKALRSETAFASVARGRRTGMYSKCGRRLCLFPSTALTNYHSVVAYSVGICSLTVPEGVRLSEVSVPAGPHCLQGRQGRIFPHLLQLLVTPDIPWLVEATLQSVDNFYPLKVWEGHTVLYGGMN